MLPKIAPITAPDPIPKNATPVTGGWVLKDCGSADATIPAINHIRSPRRSPKIIPAIDPMNPPVMTSTSILFSFMVIISLLGFFLGMVQKVREYGFAFGGSKGFWMELYTKKGVGVMLNGLDSVVVLGAGGDGEL